MEQKLLYILVEGLDDERFCRRILEAMFATRYDDVKILQYSEKTQEWVNRLLGSIKAMSADYILLADLSSCPCVTERKQKVQEKFKFCDVVSIQVVAEEIESWYLAGLNDNECSALKLPLLPTTHHLTKEEFNRLVPARFHRTELMVEILKRYSLETAVTKNTSFRYFVQKYSLLPPSET